ncbi:MAG: hypothetical protein O7E56_00505 [SAR324 cluster bacterium]|nr:hypothetical protein [SAR324 cluster bacterium]
MAQSSPSLFPGGALLKRALLQAFQARFRFGRGRFVPLGKGGAAHVGRGGVAHAKTAGGLAHAETAGGLPAAAWRAAGREVLRLHEAYTLGEGVFAHEENPLHRAQAGYQFYFLPRNFYRVRHVLGNLPWREGKGLLDLGEPSKEEEAPTPLRVLDLGCGTGAFSLALLSLLAEREKLATGGLDLRLELVDQGRDLLQMAVGNIEAYARLALPNLTLRIELHPEGVENYLAAAGKGEGFAILGGAMMLNELNLLAPRRGTRRAARFILPLRRLAAPGGLMLFVEPGTRKGYMNLIAVREQLGGLPILYPCPHGRPCPMWTPRVRRWCHATCALPPAFLFDGELQRQGRIRFRMRELNLAALAVQNTASGQAATPFLQARGSRIVSGRLPARDAPQPDGGIDGEGRQVVLQCRGDGSLGELSAERLGPHPRGLWLPSGGMPARRVGKGEQWAKKR